MQAIRILFFLASLMVLDVSCVAAQESLPRQYPLKDVRIEIEVRSGWFADTTMIELDGTGKVHFQDKMGTNPPVSHTVTLSQWEVARLLERLYEIRFFDYANEYPSIYPGIYLDGDTIRSATTRIVDLGSASVLCKIGSFEKLVKTSSKVPVDLWNYVHEVCAEITDSLKSR